MMEKIKNIYIYTHIHTHIHIYTYIYTHTHIHRYTYTYIYIYIYMRLSHFAVQEKLAQHGKSTTNFNTENKNIKKFLKTVQ